MLETEIHIKFRASLMVVVYISFFDKNIIKNKKSRKRKS